VQLLDLRQERHPARVRAVDKFHQTAGEDALTPYTFNKHVIIHNFCKTCGIKSFAHGKKSDGTPMVAINARCLDGINVFDLEVTQYDGLHNR
jgi:hypothetical protein